MTLLRPFTEPNGAQTVTLDSENLTGIYEALFYELFGVAIQHSDGNTRVFTEFL